MSVVAAGATVRRQDASLRLGAILVAALIFSAALSLFWTPYLPSALDIPHKLQTPSLAHWLGTDALGRDVLSQILAEDAIMKFCDFTFAFPALLLAILLTATYGPGVVNATLAIGIANAPIFAKLTRSSANGVLAREFTLAARAAGRGPVAIALDHVLPNVAPALIVQATIQFAIAILAEAALSYLGLGAQPPLASWGRMLADAQAWMYVAPRLAIFPGLAVALSVLGLNLLGDGLRDALDPRLRARR